MNKHSFATALMAIALSSGWLALPAQAWGPEGHAVTGILALRALDDKARQALESLLGDISERSIAARCNWPDHLRDQPHWDWAAPLHYVNIPRQGSYDRQRDCADGLCVTEAIKKYAGELQDSRHPAHSRGEAFAWLCHLVGDIHQPLHCGLAEDRGGNTIDIVFAGQQANLHQFWDSLVIRDRAGTLEHLLARLPALSTEQIPLSWNPVEVDEWTQQAHDFAMEKAYPAAPPSIDPAFAQQSWVAIQQRLPLSALRLAQILNATLGRGAVELER